MSGTDAGLLGLCLDTGHYTLGGGDAPAAIRRYARRLEHVHLKDVSGPAMAALRADPRMTFLDALRHRIFTELGNGVLDVVAVARALVEIGYARWLMCEQDTTWRPPGESAAIARRVWRFAVRQVSPPSEFDR
jgi:inosose dehydratase